MIARSRRRAGRRLFATLFAVLCSAYAATSFADTVVLKNGTKLEGKVKTQEPGKYVIIELAGGVQKTVMWEDLKEIEVAAPSPAPTPTPTPTPAPIAPPTVTAPVPDDGAPVAKKKKKKKVEETEDEDDEDDAPKPKKKKKKKGETTSAGANVDKDGNYSAGMKHECAEGDPACKDEVAIKGKGTDAEIKYTSEEDCTDEDNDACTSKLEAGGGKNGLGIGYSKESAKRVTGPKSGATQFMFGTSVILGFGEGMTMAGGNISLSARIITGGQFPGEKGGSWFGFFLEPSASISYFSVTTETPQVCIPRYGCQGGGSTTTSSGAGQAGASAGIQFLHFGKIDKKSLKQGGFGLALGGQVGGFIPFEGDASVTYGPNLSLLFPKYNPGTGSFSSTQINLMVLPLKSFTLIMAGASFGFG